MNAIDSTPTVYVVERCAPYEGRYLYWVFGEAQSAISWAEKLNQLGGTDNGSDTRFTVTEYPVRNAAFNTTDNAKRPIPDGLWPALYDPLVPR